MLGIGMNNVNRQPQRCVKLDGQVGRITASLGEKTESSVCGNQLFWE
jgi:hypothetical protein